MSRIQSANDAPERDPKKVILEGSNDETVSSFTSGNWQLITNVDVPDFTARFQWQEIHLENTNSYKHYRWTVTRTAVANGCCMQVAEVELLTELASADCTRARFITRPESQPTLEGKTATFYTTVNGPWTLQWLKNGQPIPGATSTSYATEPVTRENETNLYAVQIVGCEKSEDVRAYVFMPSATKSVGINFVGSGAKGTPASLAAEDITGVQLQAYWNNASDAASGTLAGTLLDSDGAPTAIKLDWQAGGAWGTETGTNSPSDRLFNGLVGSADSGTNSFMFSGVPAGNHSVIVYSLAPSPLQYLTVACSIGAKSFSTRLMTRDDYMRAPGFYKMITTEPGVPIVGNFTRFDNVQADADGKITMSESVLNWPLEHPVGVNAIQLVLNTPAGLEPPVITIQPQPAFVQEGASAEFRAWAAGADYYQWRKEGQNLQNSWKISGAQSPFLKIANFSAEDAGIYSLTAFNLAGSALSKNATLNVYKQDITDRLVGYWKFDEADGGTVSNAVSSGFPGAIKNSAGKETNGVFVAGQVGNALRLDGNRYVFVTNYAKAWEAMSGAAWVKIDSAAAASGKDIAIFRNAQGPLTMGGGISRVIGQFEVGLTADLNDSSLHAMAAIGLGPNVGRVTSAATISGGVWHHIAFTADGAQLRVYVDAAEVAVLDYLGYINPPDIQYISMGAQLQYAEPFDGVSVAPDSFYPKWLMGELDEVAVWTRALSPYEVMATYGAGLQHRGVTTISYAIIDDFGVIRAGLAGDNITLMFRTGKLQAAPTTFGPWTDVIGATQGPYSEKTTNAARFFRTFSQ